MKSNRFLSLLLLVGIASIVRFGVTPFLTNEETIVQFFTIILILGVGGFFLLRGSAKVIEETTEVLSERTKLAGGLLQSLGTAFPDMVLGVVAAIVSLQLRSSDYTKAIEYAIIAASTTFGSNIYNIAHAAWCIIRQNKANTLKKAVLMFPRIPAGGTVFPFDAHSVKPTVKELDTSVAILTALSMITAAVAILMVLFGKVDDTHGIIGDLYQLLRPLGGVILVICLSVLYMFRHTHRKQSTIEEIAHEEQAYRKESTLVIFLHLFLAGIIILFSAESMVHAIQTFSEITHISAVIAGSLAGIIGCLGEMLVIHNYTVHPKGRIGDALIGVGMDNIVTTMGAAIVAIMGGIFLGGSSLIVIFILIVSLNTILIMQVNQLKNYFVK